MEYFFTYASREILKYLDISLLIIYSSIIVQNIYGLWFFHYTLNILNDIVNKLEVLFVFFLLFISIMYCNRFLFVKIGYCVIFWYNFSMNSKRSFYILAESFYYVNYGSSIISSNVSQIISVMKTETVQCDNYLQNFGLAKSLSRPPWK